MLISIKYFTKIAQQNKLLKNMLTCSYIYKYIVKYIFLIISKDITTKNLTKESLRFELGKEIKIKK